MAPGLAGDHAREHLDEALGRLGDGHGEHHMRGAVVVGAVHRGGLEAEIAIGGGAGEDALLLGAHLRHHAVDAVELHVQHRAHQFGGARAVAGEGLFLAVAAVPVEVAGVDGAAHALGQPVVVDGNAAAFAAGHVLVVVEAEGADVADGAELAALIAAAHALAGILDDEQVAPPRDVHDRVHVAGRAPHVHGDHGARRRADGGLDRRGIDGDRSRRRRRSPGWRPPPAPAVPVAM